MKGKERRMFWLSKLIPREAAGCVAHPPAEAGKAQGDELVGTSGIHSTFRCLNVNVLMQMLGPPELRALPKTSHFCNPISPDYCNPISP